MNQLGKLLKITSETNLADAKTKISFSQYSKWSKCPLSWKLSYIDKIKIPNPSAILIFGTSMHETIQHYLTVMFDESITNANKINLLDVLTEQMFNNYASDLISNNNVHFSNKAELDEFLVDGNKILEYLTKHRQKYFTTKGYELIGIELPICTLASTVNENVYFLGYADLILYDKDLDTIIIYDFKTSRQGWKDKDKKDEVKRRQLIFYKSFISKMLGYDVKKIKIVYMILKRKIYEESEYPIPRIQEFKPADGTTTLKKAQMDLDKFISTCFKEDGSYNTEAKYPAISGDGNKNCQYCEFKTKYDLCPKEKRRSATI